MNDNNMKIFFITFIEIHSVSSLSCWTGIFPYRGQPHVLLTERSAKLRAHAGTCWIASPLQFVISSRQYHLHMFVHIFICLCLGETAFPGGKRDLEDAVRLSTFITTTLNHSFVMTLHWRRTTRSQHCVKRTRKLASSLHVVEFSPNFHL